MAFVDELREGVRASLPEIMEIRDEGLRNKVVDAWALALSQTEFSAIEDMYSGASLDTPPLKSGTQADHIRAVARIAQSMADGLEKVHGDIGIDRDLLWACALCHDVGKPFEVSWRNQERWKSNTAGSGLPAIRHSAYGVHIALTVGLPEAVAHTAGAHSMEGQFVLRSLENTLVHYADYSYWDIMERANQLGE